MIPLLVPIGLGLIGGYLSQDSTQTFAGGGGVEGAKYVYIEKDIDALDGTIFYSVMDADSDETIQAFFESYEDAMDFVSGNNYVALPKYQFAKGGGVKSKEFAVKYKKQGKNEPTFWQYGYSIESFKRSWSGLGAPAEQPYMPELDSESKNGTTLKEFIQKSLYGDTWSDSYIIIKNITKITPDRKGVKYANGGGVKNKLTEKDFEDKEIFLNKEVGLPYYKIILYKDGNRYKATRYFRWLEKDDWQFSDELSANIIKPIEHFIH
jgi:hypothetical protein